MNLAHLHLLMNHAAVMATLFGMVLLLSALALRNGTLTRLSLVVFAVAAALTVPVFLTGEPAEKMVSGLPGVTEAIVEQHEAAAKVALIAVVALGLLSVGALLAARRSVALPKGLAVSVVILGLIASGLMVRTANQGGQVRHTEIRSVSATFSSGERPADVLRHQDEGDRDD